MMTKVKVAARVAIGAWKSPQERMDMRIAFPSLDVVASSYVAQQEHRHTWLHLRMMESLIIPVPNEKNKNLFKRYQEMAEKEGRDFLTIIISCITRKQKRKCYIFCQGTLPLCPIFFACYRYCSNPDENKVVNHL